MFIHNFIWSGYFRRLNVRKAIRPTPSAPRVRDDGSGTVVMSRLQLASVLWLPADKSARNNDHVPFPSNPPYVSANVAPPVESGVNVPPLPINPAYPPTL